MLSLADRRWQELRHAYGSASDIPALLRRLTDEGVEDDRVWFDLWSALAHQGDVYQASFAAVPHVVEFLSKAAPEARTIDFFSFPAWVEICRVRLKMAVDADLVNAYAGALARLPELALATPMIWTGEFVHVALSAVAVSRGFTGLGEAVQELTPEVLQEFRVWFESR